MTAAPPLPVPSGLGWGAWGPDSATHSTGLGASVICAVGPSETNVRVPHPQPLQNPFGLNSPGIAGNSGPMFGALRKLRWPQCHSFPLKPWLEPDKATQPRGGYGVAGPPPSVLGRAHSRSPASHTHQAGETTWQPWGHKVEKARSCPQLAHCLAQLSPLYR